MICNKRQLADIVGKSERTLTEYQDQGLPIELLGDRGTENQYDTAKVIEWLIQRALAGQARESGRERLERLQADDLEMKIDERAGRLVSVDAVEQLLAGGIIATRSELTGLADRLKAALDGAYRVNIDPVLIENEVLQTLNKLAARAEELARLRDPGAASEATEHEAA